MSTQAGSEEFKVAKAKKEEPRHEEEEHGGHGNVLFMNLTPMIDMVFNLLIFFVMVSGGGGGDAFLQSKLPKERGAGAGEASVTKPPITIRLTKLHDGITEDDVQIQIVQSPSAISGYQQLYEKLMALKASAGDDTPIDIEPAANVKYVQAVNVYNQCVRAKFKSVAFSSMD